MNGTAPDRRELWLRIAIAVLCGLLAAWVRSVHAIGVRYPVPVPALIEAGESGESGEGAEDGRGRATLETWGSYDPDTLYHARRVARGVAHEGWIAAYDPLLAHPQPAGSVGAPIPWPPTYDLILTAIARRAAPEFDRLQPASEERPPIAVSAADRARIERLVATMPLVWGALTAALAALIVGGIVRRLGDDESPRPSTGERSAPEPAARGRSRAAAALAAAVAGITVALTFGHVRYSHLGNGDHHAFVSFLHLALLGLTTRALGPRALDQPIWSATRGAVAGLIAALLITSWTPSFLFVALIQAVLVVRLFRRYRAGDGAPMGARGLPLFATSFHKAALLGVLPATLHSPYTYLRPWSLVELSWLQPVELAVVWLTFAPYALVPRLARSFRVAALAPALLIAAAVLVFTPVGASLRDAFSWAGAANPFMSTITESQPLLGGEAGSVAALVKHAGYGVIAAPLLVVALGVLALRRAPLLPWALTLPVLVVAAVLQRRFAESLTPVLAVSLAACVGIGFRPIARRLGGRGRLAMLVVAVALAVAAHPSTLRNTAAYRRQTAQNGDRFRSSSPVALRERALAELLITARASGADEDPSASRGVLAQWDIGHAIEWRAGLPTVADNFGLYLGEASFLAPWRFFLESDAESAEALLRDRDVRYVLVDGDRNRVAAARALGIPVDRDPDAWRSTMLARLLRDGAGGRPLEAPDFLRLVALRPDGSGGRLRLYEYVPGVRLCATGSSLAVVATVTGHDPDVDGDGRVEAPREVWRGSVRAADPTQPEPLELRVPYAGTGSVALEVFLDGDAIPVEITDRNVIEGVRVFAGD